MKKFTHLILLIFLLSSCQISPGRIRSKDNHETDSIIQNKIVQVASDSILKDTFTINAKYRFYQINEILFNKLINKVIQTKIPINENNVCIKVLDSCKVLKLLNGKRDSLCDFKKGDYFEKYTIKGEWKEKNQILVRYENWEENHDILWSKTDGKLFYLTPDYKISPDNNYIFTFSNLKENPINSINILGITIIDSQEAVLDLDLDLKDYGVFEAGWIDKFTIVLKICKIEYIDYKIVENRYYLMKISK